MTTASAPGLRHAGRTDLRAGLAQVRSCTLSLFDAYEAALPRGLDIPYAPELNPPRWELGHIAWFEEWWLARFPQRLRGAAADPLCARGAALLKNADALYDSSRVAHTRRWHLSLPDAVQTRRYAAQVRERTLALLAQMPDEASADSDELLYFYRLVLAHEAMHHEAWAYMVQNLALDVGAALAATQPVPVAGRLGEGGAAASQIALPGGQHRLGSEGPGFAFDNELGAHDVDLAGFSIDATPVTWAQFLPFVEAGGYAEPRWWTDAGRAWLARGESARTAAITAPRYLRRSDSTDGWERAVFGHWVPLDPAQPAVHLSQHEALAWCAWAGRRLPTEAEWEHAAMQAGEHFAWGQVWEWTASAFAPYPGFTPHPYRDYSAPWFDGRPVLRGASFATAARMKHPKYRNYFDAGRNDIFAGFRSCALD